MKKASSSKLTTAQRDELAALPEDKIDTRGIPEATEWSGAQRGVFFRPVKQQITLRLDADVVDWFRRNAGENEGYQTSINKALREYVGRRERG
jgi:uncharacterized protein (DUF4415 family)